MKDFPPPKPHPRLFIPEGGFATLRTQVQADPVAGRIAACLQRKATQFLTEPTCRRVLEGKRLLAVSRGVLERILTLAMAARLGDEPAFARRAVAEMMAAAAFSDWNPVHFLDVAEMTLALAVGYDWLHDLLAEDERETVAAAILEKGLAPSLDTASGNCWWITGDNNWAQVCHTGMVVGALALAERDPAMAAHMIERATANLPRVAKAYAPDGAYAEGPIYWDYGTSFHLALISALESATGDDHGLADIPGFLPSAHYMFQVTGPTGKFFNYSDCGQERGFLASMLWFGPRLHEPGMVTRETARLDEFLSGYEARGQDGGYRLLALALTWHQPRPAAPGEDGGLPLHWHGRGVTPVGFHRTAWDDPDAVFVALKGGSPNSSHAHMDVGTFVLEAGGVRWAVDLGTQDYHGLEAAGLNLWEHPVRQESDRWKPFRLSHRGHSVPTFNGSPPRVNGHAPIVRFSGEGGMPHTVVDLSALYDDEVARAWRGVALLADGRVLLQDEWTAADRPVEMRWQMLTFAEAAVEGAGFVLRQDGRELHLDVLEPLDGMRLEVTENSAPVESFDAPNPGLRIIALTCRCAPGQAATLRLVASLSAMAHAVLPPLLPLARWSPA